MWPRGVADHGGGRILPTALRGLLRTLSGGTLAKGVQVFIIKDLNGGFGLGYVKEWPVKGRPKYTPFRDQAMKFYYRAEASKWLNYRTYWAGVASREVGNDAECNLRLTVVEYDA